MEYNPVIIMDTMTYIQQRLDYLTLDFVRWAEQYAVKLSALEDKYDANQPRVPAGNPDGGQWTDDPRYVVFTEYPRLINPEPEDVWWNRVDWWKVIEENPAVQAAEVLTVLIPGLKIVEALRVVRALKLAKATQLRQLEMGAGKVIAGAGHKKPINDVKRIIRQYGGREGDWTKVVSKNYRDNYGFSFQTHAYRNRITGELVDIKIKDLP